MVTLSEVTFYISAFMQPAAKNKDTLIMSCTIPRSLSHQRRIQKRNNTIHNGGDRDGVDLCIAITPD